MIANRFEAWESALRPSSTDFVCKVVGKNDRRGIAAILRVDKGWINSGRLLIPMAVSPSSLDYELELSNRKELGVLFNGHPEDKIYSALGLDYKTDRGRCQPIAESGWSNYYRAYLALLLHDKSAENRRDYMTGDELLKSAEMLAVAFKSAFNLKKLTPVSL
ncbi:MAG: hypothetical protein AAB697_03540 [Patescibacteria group bacterium]